MILDFILLIFLLFIVIFYYLQQSISTISLTRFELSEDLGGLESTKPRQDAVDLKVLAAVRRLGDDATNTVIRHHRLITRKRRHCDASMTTAQPLYQTLSLAYRNKMIGCCCDSRSYCLGRAGEEQEACYGVSVFPYSAVLGAKRRGPRGSPGRKGILVNFLLLRKSF